MCEYWPPRRLVESSMYAIESSLILLPNTTSGLEESLGALIESFDGCWDLSLSSDMCNGAALEKS